MNLGYHPSIHAAKAPDKPAIISSVDGEVVTYAELDDRSNQTAQMLRGRGLQTGDGVLIMCENHARYLELVWGAQRAGLYYTPASWHLKHKEVLHILENSGAKIFIASARFSDVAQAVAENCSANVKLFSMLGDIPGFEPYEEERAQYPDTPIPDEASGKDMLYTSGTTGVPKGVKFPLSGQPIDYVDDMELAFQAAGYVEDAICTSFGPMYHPSSLYTGMLTNRFGGTWVVIDKFDAEQGLKVIEQYGVQQLICVPTHFVRILKLPEHKRQSFDVSSLTCVLHTAAPCPVDVKHKMIEWLGPIILEFYGGTEKVGGTTITSQEWLEHPGSIGRSLTGDVHVVDEATWTEMPVGETGVIYFETGAEFTYHEYDEKTRSVLSPEGWKTLGDIGHVDADGYIYLTDRKSNMIISGGVNIYPQEAENVLMAHPKVQDVAVFGIPDADFGERVKAAVQPVEWSDATPAIETELIAFCKEQLASMKCPRSIDFEHDLPREANGKLYKNRLIEKYKQKEIA